MEIRHTAVRAPLACQPKRSSLGVPSQGGRDMVAHSGVLGSAPCHPSSRSKRLFLQIFLMIITNITTYFY